MLYKFKERVEKRSEGDCFKHRIVEEVGFTLFLDCIKNLKKLKENVGYSKQKEGVIMAGI